MFSFDGQIYEQIQGTAMGTKMAPSYANLFMDRFERAFLAREPIQPLLWKRYIDDILCVWTGTRSELEGFLDRLNKAHRTTNLLDISTHVKKNQIHSNTCISLPLTPGVSSKDW